jgi:hypothetical protein
MGATDWFGLESKHGADFVQQYKKAKKKAEKADTEAATAAFVADVDKVLAAWGNNMSSANGKEIVALKAKYGEDWLEKYNLAKGEEGTNPITTTDQAVPGGTAAADDALLVKDVEDVFADFKSMGLDSNDIEGIKKTQIGQDLASLYGPDWDEKYAKAKAKEQQSTGQEGQILGPVSDNAKKIVDVLDKALKSAPGLTFDAIAADDGWDELMSGSFGANWKEEYKNAKGITPQTAPAADPSYTAVAQQPVAASATTTTEPDTNNADEYAFISGSKTASNLKAVYNTAVSKLVPPNHSDPLSYLLGKHYFKEKMKGIFGQKWVSNLKKALEKDASGTSNDSSASHDDAIHKLVSNVLHSGDMSMSAVVDDAITKLYDHDPGFWNNDLDGNVSDIIDALSNHSDFNAVMSDKYGNDWKAAYKATTGTFKSPATGVAHNGYVFPAMADLTLVGSAAHHGGNKDKMELKDQLGNTFMFKPADDGYSRAYAGEVASSIAHLMYGEDEPGSYIPVKAANHSDVGFGSVQPIVKGKKADLDKVSLKTLNKDQIRALQRERVLDWLISNHDSKAGNFMLMNDGKIIGVDKEQAFKFIGNDELNLTYKPNNSEPVYNSLYKMFANKEIDLDPNDMLPYIEKVEKISDEAWLKTVTPYVSSHAGSNTAAQQNLFKKILGRKKNLRADFEKFITDLKIKRGELKPGEKFTFKGLEAGKLTPDDVPYAHDLTYHMSGSQYGLTGAGIKDVYTDKKGKHWLFKLAIEKSGDAMKPYAAHVQAGFAKVAKKIKPFHLPIGVTYMGGKIGTLQPVIPGEPGTLVGVDPHKLSPQEKIDVATEHVLDWLGSQHDSHGANFLRVDGHIIGIDKEQGFRYFGSPGQYGNDVLSDTWQPPGNPETPYYNQFWGDWKAKKFDFDPQTMAKAIEDVEALDDDEYMKTYEAYADALPQLANKPVQKKEFLQAVLARKQNIRNDFEAFLTKMYQQKTGETGKFSFKGGWKSTKSKFIEKKTTVQASSAHHLDEYAGIQPIFSSHEYSNIAEKPYKNKATGETDETKQTLKLANHHPVEMLQKYLDHLGIKPIGKIENGPVNHVVVVDKPSFLNAKAKNLLATQNIALPIHQPVAKLEKFLKDFGLKTIGPITSAGANHLAVVSKAAYDAAKTEKVELIDTSLNPQPEPAVHTNFPKIEPHPEVTPNFEKMHKIHTEHFEPTGHTLHLDGGHVEGQVAKVQKMKDTTGKTYFRVNFKLTDHAWEPLQHKGTPSEWANPLAKYDPAFGGLVEGGTIQKPPGGGLHGKGVYQGGSVNLALSSKKWVNGKSEFHLNTNKHDYSFMGNCTAKLYLEPGQTVTDALRAMVKKVHPDLEGHVFKNPTKNEIDLMKAARLAWAANPMKTRSLPQHERTLLNYKKIAADAGHGEADFKKVKSVETIPGHMTHVLPGRHKTIAGGKFKGFFHGISDEQAVLGILKAGILGINERTLSGLELTGTSVGSDISSGSGDGILTYALCQKSIDKNFNLSDPSFSHWVQAIIAPEEADRLDLYMHTGDHFGAWNEDDHNWTSIDSFSNTINYMQMYGSNLDSHEVSFRKGINKNKILRIACKDNASREKIIKSAKKEGIHEVNGVPIDEFIMVCRTTKEVDDKILKKMGY